MSEHKTRAPRKRRGRRGNNEGTIRQRSDGRWEARLSLPSGEQLSYYGKTRGEALDKLRGAQVKYGSGGDLVASRQTVEDFLTFWMETSVRPRLAPKTHGTYRDIVELHLIPELGSVRLASLTPRHVSAMLKRKQDAGLSPRRVHHIRAVLRTALNQAMRWELVSRNVASLTDPVRQEPRSVVAFTAEEVRAILTVAQDHRLYALFVAAMALGLRQGEVLGLHWQDVDFAAGTIRVRVTLQRIDGQLILRPPKTERSRRLLQMPAVIATALRQHRDRQEFERQRAGEAWIDTDLVFTTQRGTSYDPRNLIRDWHALQERAGVERQRFHNTRHTAISTMAAMGVPLKVIQEVVGHSMLATTADIYTHVAPAEMVEAAAAIDRAFGQSTYF